jgi:hypothetical protein
VRPRQARIVERRPGRRVAPELTVREERHVEAGPQGDLLEAVADRLLAGVQVVFAPPVGEKVLRVDRRHHRVEARELCYLDEQALAQRAAEAAVRHRHEPLVDARQARARRHEPRIDVHLAPVVDDDCHPTPLAVGGHVVQERRLAGPEEAEKDGDWPPLPCTILHEDCLCNLVASAASKTAAARGTGQDDGLGGAQRRSRFRRRRVEGQAGSW